MSPPAEVPSVGDPAAWVDRYGDALLAFALGRVRDREVAEDLVQETLLTAWKYRDRFDGRSQFATWLTGILRKKVADHYRKRGRTVATSSIEAEPPTPFSASGAWSAAPRRWRGDPCDAAESAELHAVAQGCVGELPPLLQQAFVLRDLGDASPNEASAILGISRENLAVRLHRARVFLRQCLENRYFGPSTPATPSPRGRS
ncbi:MAG: RNA polymerase sigma factor [Lacipirellulaceae bacterium]